MPGLEEAVAVLSTPMGLLLVAGVGCVYRSSPESGLCRDRTIDSKPFRGSRVFSGDIENLVFVNEEDTLWISDDNANQIENHTLPCHFANG